MTTPPSNNNKTRLVARGSRQLRNSSKTCEPFIVARVKTGPIVTSHNNQHVVLKQWSTEKLTLAILLLWQSQTPLHEPMPSTLYVPTLFPNRLDFTTSWKCHVLAERKPTQESFESQNVRSCCQETNINRRRQHVCMWTYAYCLSVLCFLTSKNGEVYLVRLINSSPSPSILASLQLQISAL